MGTHCVTTVKDGANTILTMYRQYDGYPGGHGQELKDFLDQFTIVNGLTPNVEGKIANGMQCLAAQIVAHFKTEPGSFYLVPAGQTEEYEYILDYHQDKLMIQVYYGATVIYAGLVSEWKIT